MIFGRGGCRRQVGQSPGSEDEDDQVAIDTASDCEFCDDPGASFWISFAPPPHGKNVTLPRRLGACRVCAEAIRAGNAVELDERISMGGGWPDDAGLARLVIRNVVGVGD